MKRKRRENRNFMDPENKMRIWLLHLDGEKEDQSDGEKEDQLDDSRDSGEEEKTEARELALRDEDFGSRFFMPAEDYPRVDDWGLQIALLESALLCSSSISTNQDSSKKIPCDEKMKGICTESLNPLWTLDSWTSSVREIGEPSCDYCVICVDAKPLRSTIRSDCGHCFCGDCFRIYIGKELQENILSVKCPEKGCKILMGAKFWSRFVPVEVFDRWKSAYLEGILLVSPKMIECPCCFCEFIDDGRDFLIRACTKCWKIFCLNCRVRWHMGMHCRRFKLLKKRVDRIMVDVDEFIHGINTDFENICWN